MPTTSASPAADIYTLEAFKVTGEREGDALAITAQRNADNVKNIVAMDSFGNLPNMSAGEVVMRLPGIAGNPTDEGLAYEFNVRGMAPSLLELPPGCPFAPRCSRADGMCDTDPPTTQNAARTLRCHHPLGAGQ